MADFNCEPLFKSHNLQGLGIDRNTQLQDCMCIVVDKHDQNLRRQHDAYGLVAKELLAQQTGTNIAQGQGAQGQFVLFPEFDRIATAYWEKLLHLREEDVKIRKLFSSIDRDGSGYADAAELKFFFVHQSKMNVPDEYIDQLIAQSDRDGNGEMDVDGTVLERS